MAARRSDVTPNSRAVPAPQQGATDLEVRHTSTPPGSCEISHEVVRGWHLLVVRGDLVGDAASELVAVIVDVSTASPNAKVIADLARASSVSQECVADLHRVSQQLRRNNGDFRLVVDGVVTLQAVRAAGLSGQFEIHRYVGDIVGAVPGLDEVGRGNRRAHHGQH